MSLGKRIYRFLRHNRVVLFCRLLGEAIREVCSQTLHLGVSQMYDDEVKFAADLKIRVHAIEKGLSIGSCRAGFGRPKVISLIKDLILFTSRFPHANIDEAVDVIACYIAYNRFMGIDMSEIGVLYKQLCDLYSIREDLLVGVVELNRSETLSATQASFDRFSTSRFSIRDFAPDAHVDIQDIIAAVNIARKAPSACNRQPSRVHIYEGAKAQTLFDFQGGCKGFYQDMPYALLVTADMRRYFFNERHQMYVDGGLFSMELLLALHYKGLATIPLTTAYKSNKTSKLHRCFDIPAYEVPIIIIGVGAYKDSYKVAVSHRNPLEDYYTIHR